MTMDTQLLVGLGLLLAALVLLGLRHWYFFRLWMRLKHLPKMEAHIVWARLRHGRSFEQIGNEMGKCRQYVHYRFDRGMQRLNWPLRENRR